VVVDAFDGGVISMACAHVPSVCVAIIAWKS
jgi:hypothetical protein